MDVAWGYANLDDNRQMSSAVELALDPRMLPFGLGAALMAVVRNNSHCPQPLRNSSMAAALEEALDYAVLFQLPLPLANLSSFARQRHINANLSSTTRQRHINART